MRLGILSDIHEAVVPLKNALERFDREGIDRVVILGDLYEVGKRLEDTIALLKPYSPIGVWGNHDWGLCGEVVPKIRARFSDEVFAFMQTLRPQLEVEGMFFQHIEPWLDANDIEHLWGWFDPPDLAQRYDVASQQSPIGECLWVTTTAGSRQPPRECCRGRAKDRST